MVISTPVMEVGDHGWISIRLSARPDRVWPPIA